MRARGRACLAGALALLACTGCVPVFVPVVQQDLTAGEKLRSIDAVARDPGAFVDHERPTRTADTGQAGFDRAARIAQVSGWCAETRGRLVSGPVVLEATVYSPEGTTSEGYGVLNPGLFNPVDRELADLRRARDAGVLGAEECARLEAALGAQARRPPVRRAAEGAPVAVDLSFTHLDSSFFDWSSRRSALPARWWMAKRVRIHDQVARGSAWRKACLDEPGIPTPNAYSLPPVFRLRAVSGGAP
jgi:hypothetical protein